MKTHLILSLTFVFIQCSHDVTVVPEDYSKFDGWLHGEIYSSGIGAVGSPAASSALEDGRIEVLNEICADRKVKFSAIAPSTKTVHSLYSSVSSGSVMTFGSSRDVQIAEGYSYICADWDQKTDTYLIDMEKISCKKFNSFAPGEKRIGGIKANPETERCRTRNGWFRAKLVNQDTIDVFVGKEGLATCKKLIGQFLETNSSNMNLFLLRVLNKCRNEG